MRAAQEMPVQRSDWKNAAITPATWRAGVDRSAACGRRGRCPSVDQPRGPGRRCVRANGDRATAADALHQSGRRAEAARSSRKPKDAKRRSRSSMSTYCQVSATATGSSPPRNSPRGSRSSTAQFLRPWRHTLGQDGPATICNEVEKAQQRRWRRQPLEALFSTSASIT